MNRLFKTNGKDEDVIKNVLEHYEQPSIINLNFDIFMQSNFDFATEFINNENQINEISIVNQIEYYQFIKEIASYVTGTKIDKKTSNFKVNSNKYREEKRIEIEFFERLYEHINWVEVRFYCTKIIEFLNIKKIELFTPQHLEADKPDEVKNQPQHTEIFKDNNFEIWQRMFDEFNITKSSRTDIDFMFQIMKYDNLIHENIGLTDIQKWINKVYEIAFDKIKYTDPKQTSNEKRMIAYNLINPK